MRGIIYALLAMISYSSTPTFTQVGYKAGIETDTLLFSRHLVSLICLMPVALKKSTYSAIGKKQIPGLLILASFSIVGNLTFNHAYHYLPNMIAVSVSLSYIVFVFIIEILLGRERFTAKRGLIISLTALGLIVIAIPGFDGAFDMKAFMIGLFASLVYSTQVSMINSKILRQVPADIIVLTSVIPIMIFSGIRCLFRGESLLPSNGMQWFAIICLGTIGVIFARGLFYRSMRLIGATKASMIDSLEPFSSAVLGFLLLGQGLSPYTVAGSVLMMASIILLLKEKDPHSAVKATEGP